MYAKHFGLEMMPYENVPDPRFFFNESNHARVKNRISGSLETGKGLTVVTGPIGSGKTTLSQIIISNLSDDTKLIWMAEPPRQGIDLFLFVALELGLQPASQERVFVLRDIRNALMDLNSEGKNCVLIIDESHLMTDDVIDSIRILNNLEETSDKLIKVLLLGQIEIMEVINRPEMEPFKQRITLLENLGRMNAERIRRYILYRIKVAGGNSSIFTDTALEALVLAAGTGGGIPRVTNSLCDRSLISAFEKKEAQVDIDDVYSTAGKMGIDKEIFHYKIEMRTKGQNGGASFSGEHDTSIKPASEKESAPDLTEKLDTNVIENEESLSEAPVPAHEESGNGSSNTVDHKGFKDYCTTFLNRVIGRGETESAKKEDISGKQETDEGESIDEPVNPSIDKEEVAEEMTTPVKRDEPALTDKKDSEELRVSEDTVIYKEQADTSSEWVTMSTTGKPPLEFDDKQKRPKKKTEVETASEWIRIDSKGTKLLSPVNINNREK